MNTQHNHTDSRILTESDVLAELCGTHGRVNGGFAVVRPDLIEALSSGHGRPEATLSRHRTSVLAPQNG